MEKPGNEASFDPNGANGRTSCECDNTHEANDTVCQYCWSLGRRHWNDPEPVPPHIPRPARHQNRST